MSSRPYALWGRLGAHTLHAHHDPAVTTSAARRKFLDRFEQEADPDGVLPADERARRARHLRIAHMTRLALLSAEARRRRATRRKGGVR